MISSLNLRASFLTKRKGYSDSMVTAGRSDVIYFVLYEFLDMYLYITTSFFGLNRSSTH